jgi:hypothetical protein
MRRASFVWESSRFEICHMYVVAELIMIEGDDNVIVWVGLHSQNVLDLGLIG